MKPGTLMAAQFRPADLAGVAIQFPSVMGWAAMSKRVARRPVKVVMKVDKVYLAVSDQGSGEGLYAVTGRDGEGLPLVAVDPKGLSRLEKYSQQLANASGHSVSIICFTGRTHHETFRPSTTGDKGS